MFRQATLMENQRMALDTAVGALMQRHQDLAQRALHPELNTSKQAENDRDTKAKKCCDSRYKDGQKSCIRWILAVPTHPEFVQAMSVLKQTRNLEALQIKVEEDRATMSKAAKEIKDALKASGSGSGSSSSPKETPKKMKYERDRLRTKTNCRV